MYKEVLEKYGVEQTPEFTMDIIVYELGRLFQLKVYKVRFGEVGFLGDEGIELADLITSSKLLAEQKGFNIQELEEIGFERFKDRIAEVSRQQK